MVWHGSEQNLRFLVLIAGRLRAISGSMQVVSLGQSPAWVARTARMLHPDFDYIQVALSKNPPNRKPGHMATLENYNKLRQLDPKIWVALKRSGLLPGPFRFSFHKARITEGQRANYHAYLASLKLAPGDIISNPKPYLFVDHVTTGRTFVTLMGMLLNRAKELKIDPRLVTERISLEAVNFHSPIAQSPTGRLELSLNPRGTGFDENDADCHAFKVGGNLRIAEVDQAFFNEHVPKTLSEILHYAKNNFELRGEAPDSSAFRAFEYELSLSDDCRLTPYYPPPMWDRDVAGLYAKLKAYPDLEARIRHAAGGP